MKFDIENEICLGISHSGAVMTRGTNILELDDNEVSILVNLIREKKTSDVDELGIEESHPALYEKLSRAYYDMAYRAEELHWLWEGYYDGCYEYDHDKLKSYCKASCGFYFEYDEADYTNDEGELDEDSIEEAENEAFSEWLEDYVAGLDDDKACEFFYDHMNSDLNLDDIHYEVKIPKAIVEMAQNIS